MSENSYPIDDVITLSNTFTRIDTGALIDPPSVTLYVLDPSGNETSYTLSGGQVIRDSAGQYHMDLTASISGRWWYKWQGSGAGVNSTSPDTSFFVQPSLLIPG